MVPIKVNPWFAGDKQDALLCLCTQKSSLLHLPWLGGNRGLDLIPPTSNRIIEVREIVKATTKVKALGFILVTYSHRVKKDRPPSLQPTTEAITTVHSLKSLDLGHRVHCIID